MPLEIPLASSRIQPTASPSVGERLARQRAEMFVGRERELTALAERIGRASGGGVAIAHGPGGVGKTELLNEHARRCRARGIPVVWLDAELVGPRQEAFETALRAAAGPARCLWVVDGLEHARSLAPWLRAELLPRLPAGVDVVIADRGAPGPAWRAHALLALPLDGLDADERRSYLSRRGVAEGALERTARASFGHPLTLALAAERALAGDGDGSTPLALHPDVVQAVVARLLPETPTAAQRRALWCAAVALELAEDLLSAMLPGEDAAALLRWLRGHAFVLSDGSGLSPRDFARAQLRADLRWRDPSLESDLVRRATIHLAAALQATKGQPERFAAVTRSTSYLLGRARAGAVQATRAREIPAPTGAPIVDRKILEGALPRALRALDRPDLLRQSPLIGLRLLDRPEPDPDPFDRSARLSELLRDAFGMFDCSARDECYRRILARTYLSGPAVQVEAAVDLHMSHGSYRRHHATAVRRLAGELWSREIAARAR